MNIPLNIDWQQILLHVLNFVILFGGLYFLLYKPVKNFMAKREAHYAEMAQKAQSELDSAEKIKADYQEQLKSVEGEISAKIKALRLELKKAEGQQMDMEDYLQMVRRYTHVTKITQRMVSELIDHIDVYHAEKRDGVTNQRIVIHYN